MALACALDEVVDLPAAGAPHAMHRKHISHDAYGK